MHHVDLAIIGTGSGNTILGPQFDGMDIVLIEDGTFGGTCLNVGCIPTKMYVYPADLAHAIEDAARFGVDAHIDKVRWTDIRDRVFGRIDPITAAGRRYRVEDCTNVTVLEGHARFTGPRTLDVDGTALSADQIVIAAGARPHIPDVVLTSGVPFHTSDDVMRIDALPERMVILGGGYIAAEFAHVFSALGVQISVVNRGAALLRHLDETISRRFTELAKARWDVHLGAAPQRVEGDASGVRVHLGADSVVEGNCLLVATGRTPNSDRLGLDMAGVGIHDDGRIEVDEHQRTSVPGVFALGDVSSPYQLKHVANHEARVVAHNLLHPDDLMTTDHRFVPAAVFTEPQIASVGLTEQAAQAQGLDFAVSVQDYGSVAYGWALEDTTGLCKIIAERGTGRLLGAHLIGDQASTVIQPLIQAMSFGLGAREMAHGQYWIHPALPELVENALLALDL